MATSSFEVTSTVTLAGIAAAIDAGASGPQINIIGFRIGSDSAAEGSVALNTDTDVDNFAFAGDLSFMTYTRIDDDTVCWRIGLDTTIGNFDVGNIGLMIEGDVLFAKAVLPGKSNKYKSDPPKIVGNRKFYNIILTLTNVANLLDLSIIESTTCSLPEVATEVDLPVPNTTPFNAWLVRNHTHIGQPVIAVRRNDDWDFAPYNLYPNQGIGILASVTALYDGSCTTPSVVGFNTTSKTFFPADSDVVPAVGIRTDTYQLTTTGMIPGALFSYLPATLTLGTFYYAGTGANVGKLVTTAVGPIVAIAISTKDLWVNCSGRLTSDALTGGSDGGISITTPWAVDSGLLPGAPVWPDIATHLWKAADPLVVGKHPVGCLNIDKTKVILPGNKLVLPSIGSAWPLPLTVNARYFNDTGGNAGKATASDATRWILGRAIEVDTVALDFLAVASPADMAAWPHTEKYKVVSPFDLPKHTVASTAPSSPRVRDTWFYTTDETKYMWLSADGTNFAWFEY